MRGKGAQLTRTSFCQTLGCTKYQFDLWVTDGMPVEKKPAGPGDGYLVRMGDAVAWLVARAEGRLDREEIDAERERGLLYREQRIRAELENARLRGELLPAAEVVAGWQAAIGRARALLLGIPTAAAANLVQLMHASRDDHQRAERLIRDHLRDEIDDALTELGNTSIEEGEDGEPEADVAA
jgi:phage terminase Nu1 subunit (DNA packaging protein)